MIRPIARPTGPEWDRTVERQRDNERQRVNALAEDLAMGIRVQQTIALAAGALAPVPEYERPAGSQSRRDARGRTSGAYQGRPETIRPRINSSPKQIPDPLQRLNIPMFLARVANVLALTTMPTQLGVGTVV